MLQGRLCYPYPSGCAAGGKEPDAEKLLIWKEARTQLVRRLSRVSEVMEALLKAEAAQSAVTSIDSAGPSLT